MTTEAAPEAWFDPPRGTTPEKGYKLNRILATGRWPDESRGAIMGMTEGQSFPGRHDSELGLEILLDPLGAQPNPAPGVDSAQFDRDQPFPLQDHRQAW